MEALRKEQVEIKLSLKEYEAEWLCDYIAASPSYGDSELDSKLKKELIIKLSDALNPLL